MNSKSQAFEQFLASQSVQIPLLSFFLNMLIAAFLAFLLARLYVKFGNSNSNRVNFSRNFVLLTVATMVIISIVKSSLALSLGLVGALSIVRFRAAIKEPEELIYLFLAIVIGLGMGADQAPVVIVAFLFVCGIIMAKGLKKIRQTENPSLYITISTEKTNDISLKKITEITSGVCEAIDLKRYDSNSQAMEVVFHASLKDISSLDQLNQNLKSLDNEIRVTYLDQEGIIG
jgi:NADH:ubiquinone oxidoreductase subunit 5 (subunit L)/multisubunit Na+/H+ antiporter MnhA subunit